MGKLTERQYKRYYMKVRDSSVTVNYLKNKGLNSKEFCSCRGSSCLGRIRPWNPSSASILFSGQNVYIVEIIFMTFCRNMLIKFVNFVLHF